MNLRQLKMNLCRPSLQREGKGGNVLLLVERDPVEPTKFVRPIVRNEDTDSGVLPIKMASRIRVRIIRSSSECDSSAARFVGSTESRPTSTLVVQQESPQPGGQASARLPSK
jgi:hypothetical protein